ncbi:9637_t:CDS:2, partial [Paraglomus occultum]
MTSKKNNNYFIRVATKTGLDDLQKGNVAILYNSNFHSWSYVRKVLFKVVGSANALKDAATLVNTIFGNLEKSWDNLIKERGQCLNNEREHSVEVDLVCWTKRVFAEIIMLLVAGQQSNLLSNYYDRIIGKNIQKSADEDFLDRFSLASDCVQYYITVPPLIRNIPIVRRYTEYLHNNLIWTREYACNLVKQRKKDIKDFGIDEKLTSNVLNNLLTSKDISNAISLTDEEIGDNIVEMFSEGLDSPSNTLAFIIYFVGANPDVENSIIQEIKN